MGGRLAGLRAFVSLRREDPDHRRSRISAKKIWTFSSLYGVRLRSQSRLLLQGRTRTAEHDRQGPGCPVHWHPGGQEGAVAQVLPGEDRGLAEDVILSGG